MQVCTNFFFGLNQMLLPFPQSRNSENFDGEKSLNDLILVLHLVI